MYVGVLTPNMFLLLHSQGYVSLMTKGVCVCVYIKSSYISSEQLVGLWSLWPALSIARMSLLAVS